MDKVLWLDFETGGLDPQKCDITQAAGIIEIDGKVVEEFELRARPDSADRVTAEALKVTGLTLEEVMAYPLTQTALYANLQTIFARHINKFDKEDKFVWAGQNPRFDMDFARALWAKNGDKYFGSWFWSNPADLIGFAMGMRIAKQLPPLKNYRLVTLAEALEVPLDAHKAIEDVRATRACFYKLASRIPTGAAA